MQAGVGLLDTDVMPILHNDCLGYRHNFALFYQLLDSNLFTHTTKKRHIRDILGRTEKNCHTYDTSMTIIVTKSGIIIDVVGSYFYEKNHDKNGLFVHPTR